MTYINDFVTTEFAHSIAFKLSTSAFLSCPLSVNNEVSYEIYDSYKKGIKPIEIRNRYYGSIGR